MNIALLLIILIRLCGVEEGAQDQAVVQWQPGRGTQDEPRMISERTEMQRGQNRKITWEPQIRQWIEQREEGDWRKRMEELQREHYGGEGTGDIPDRPKGQTVCRIATVNYNKNGETKLQEEGLHWVHALELDFFIVTDAGTPTEGIARRQFWTRHKGKAEQ